MRTDCADCTMQHTDVCGDCIVTYLLDRRPGAVVFDAAEERALRALEAGGLAPGPRFEAVTGGAGGGAVPAPLPQAEPA